MSTTIQYKGNTLATVSNNTKTLKTAGKYMEGDVVLTDVSGGSEAISVVDTLDSHGGTIRTITAVDISDTTAQASDVAQGKYFYTADGTKTEGTSAGGGGGSVTQDQDGFIVLPPDGGGGSGGSSWELLASQEFTVSTESTSNDSVGTISLDLSKYNDPETMVWVHIRDKAGKRAGYVYGSDAIFFSSQLANGSTSSLSIRPVILFYVNSDGKYIGSASAYGVYGYRLYYTSSAHSVDIYSKYSQTYGAIDGTFKCDVYALKPPSGMKLFEVEEENE